MKIKKKRKIIVLTILLCVSVIFLTLVYQKYPFLFKSNKNNVIVLAYHHFVTKEEKNMYFPNNGDVITVDKFEEQLKYLKLKKYNPITLEQLYCWINNECKLPKKSVLITIDDGNLSTYKYALPLLEKYGFNGVAFVITSRIQPVTEEWIPGRLIFMGKDLIEDIQNNHENLEIASHTHNLHRKIDNLPPKDVLTLNELEEDLKLSKEISNADYFAYPFGSYNEKYITALKNQGFKMAFTYGPFRSVTNKEESFAVPRISIGAETPLFKFKLLLKK